MPTPHADDGPLTLRDARVITGEMLISILLRLELIERAIQALSRPTSTPDLSPMEQSVMAAIEPSPLTAKKLAAKMGRKSVSGHFRAALRALVRRGLVIQTPDGYKKKGEPQG